VDREFIGRTIGKGSEQLLRRTLDEAGGVASLAFSWSRSALSSSSCALTSGGGCGGGGGADSSSVVEAMLLLVRRFCAR
jgi:hypothetical protein